MINELIGLKKMIGDSGEVSAVDCNALLSNQHNRALIDDNTPTIRYVIIDENNGYVDEEFRNDIFDNNSNNSNINDNHDITQELQLTHSQQLLECVQYDHHPAIQNDSERTIWMSRNPELSAVSASSTCYLSRCAVCDALFDAKECLAHAKSCKLEKLLRCSTCGSDFNVEKNLLVHELIEHLHVTAVDSKYCCPICSMAFSRLVVYKTHLRSHFVGDVLVCSFCAEEFDYQALLNKHLRHEHCMTEDDNLVAVQICKQCGIVMFSDSAMDEHKLMHRKINKTMKRCKRRRVSDNVAKSHRCTICTKSFRRQFELKRHLIVHTRERLFLCEICCKGFSQKSTLRQHKALHAGAEAVQEHKCTLCNASFSQAGNLRRHVNSLHPPDVTSKTVFRCPDCACVFRSIQPLQVHLRKRHPEEGIIEKLADKNEAVSLLKASEKRRRLVCCSMCGKAFGKTSDFVRHYRIHSTEPHFAHMQHGRNFALKPTLNLLLASYGRRDNLDSNNVSARCPMCAKKFASNFSLRRHMKIHARALESCSFCAKSFANKMVLKKHEMNCGNVEAQFCSKNLVELSSNSSRFGQVASYQSYNCRTCPATFSTLRNLKDHVNRHTGIKPHFCRICHKSFFSLAQLKSHREIHTGNKLFKCNYCIKMFRHRLEVKTHEKTHKISCSNDIGLPVTSILKPFSNEFADTESNNMLSLQRQPQSDEFVRSSNIFTPKTMGSNPKLFDSCDVSCISLLENDCMPQSDLEVMQLKRESRCPICLFSFASDSLLSSHLLNMSSDPAHSISTGTCDSCHQSFPGCVALAQHILDYHCTNFLLEKCMLQDDLEVMQSKKGSRCPICLFSFASDSSLSNHLLNMASDSAHSLSTCKCDSCHRSFLGCVALAQHILYNHCTVPSQLNMEFASNAVVEIDIELKSNNVILDYRRHKCDVCGRGFKKASDLVRHKRVHTGEKPYSCSVCNHRFRVKSTLYQHLKVHDSSEGDREMCTICGKFYCSLSALRQHLSLSHAEELLYKCEVDMCEKRFKTSRRRDAHVRRCHSVMLSKEFGGDNIDKSMERVVLNEEEQFRMTAAQLAPSKEANDVVEPSLSSAFSRIISNDVINSATHIALKLQPLSTPQTIEVGISALCVSDVREISHSGSIAIPMTVLRSLFSQGILLRIAVTYSFLSVGSFVVVDPRRLFNILSLKAHENIFVPVNLSTESSGLPVGIFADSQNYTSSSQSTTFFSNCAICDENFGTLAESDAHFRSADHETAQLFSLPHLGQRSELNSITDSNQIAQSHFLIKNGVYKQCLSHFEARESLTPHVRGEHERDSINLLDRTDLLVRRRTVN